MTTRTVSIRMPNRRTYIRKNTKKGAITANFIHTIKSIKGFLAITILLTFIGLSIFTTYQIKNVANDIKLLEERYMALQIENQELNKDFSKLANKNHLAKLGKSLGLQRPSKHQIITLSE